jgi:competence protein CoiA
MKYALSNGENIEATKGAKGLCRSCGADLIAKCGEDRANHWAHKGMRICDPWWENETAWHRAWKNNFPEAWQEVIHFDGESGEKHIADVKTDAGWVLEFQHSLIQSEERRSRNAFYKKIAWVVDGTRRVRDKSSFIRVLSDYRISSIDSRFQATMAPEDCKLIKDWHDCNALVFLDMHDVDDGTEKLLWFLFPKVVDGLGHVWPISKQKVIEAFKDNSIDELVSKTILPFIQRLVNEERSKIQREVLRPQMIFRPTPVFYRTRRRRF